ncbi:MAG: serine/threonine protein kinase, partial [Planctomycetes bacterium]|nr:serine/threonine protein kinase [Planctomycetota bacterium]
MAVLQEEVNGLPSDSWERIGRLIQSFEEAWLRGERPALDLFLPADPDERQAALVELVHAELEFSLKNGDPARVESYLQRYPELAAKPEVVLELIAAEFRHRGKREPGVTVAEYLSRFPDRRDSLLKILNHPDLLHTRVRPPAPEKPEILQARSGLTTQASLSQETPSAPPPLNCLQIPGYEILEELARGGMGVVYKARDLQLNRLVAVKMLRIGAGAHSEELHRFRLEAQAAARLQHPNIVQIYDVGEQNGLPYFVLELVEGGNLAEKLARKALPPDQAAEIAEVLARAMHFAHQRG